MTVINLSLDLKKSNYNLKNEDKKELSFLVSKVFDEYIESRQDLELSKQIKKSKKLDSLLNNVKI